MTAPSSQISEIATPDWLDKTVFPFRSRRVSVLGHQIHFVDEGDSSKPTLLLLHGNGTWSFGFRRAIPALARHFRVIAPDYPGFGLSRAVDNDGSFAFKPAEHSAVIEAFADMLDLKDIRLFVEDWGGPIGLGWAGRRPELIHSLVICNTWAWPADGIASLERFSALAGSSVAHFMITRFNALERFVVPNIAAAGSMTDAERRGYYMPYPTPESREPQAMLPREIVASRDYLAEVETSLAKLAGKPVLLLWGEKDPGFGPDQRLRFQEHFPHASIVTLPEAKHFLLLDEPDKGAEAIVEFEQSM